MFLLETFRLGLHNLWLHKLRSLLTALGIIIGVAAVVAISAYGEGSKRAALADIRELGATNIILRSVRPPEATTAGGESRSRLISYGLLRRDRDRIRATLAPITSIVSLKEVGGEVYRGNRKAPATVFGVEPADARLGPAVARGRALTLEDGERLRNVAVVGPNAARLLFPLLDPLASVFYIDDQPFRVVGVLEEGSLAGQDVQNDVFIPMASAISRFGDQRVRRRSGSMEATQVELHALIVQAVDEASVIPLSLDVQRALELEHPKLQDVAVSVPLELLRQTERTQQLFTVLMVVIAGLSLLVGGIGIMNIMLASVTERTREIGVRRAMGATRRDIVAQFLVETTALAGLGGVIGLIVGVAAVAVLWLAAQRFAALTPPALDPLWMVVAFLFATLTGIAFGLYPAVKASRQDPIVALRHD